MLIYLLYDNGLDTGETFRTWYEVHQWAYERLGRYPDAQMKRQMREERYFTIGAQTFKCEKRRSASLTAVA
jgi:hypothetical protein